MSAKKRSGSFYLSPKKHANFGGQGVITPSTRRQSITIAAHTPASNLIEQNNDEAERRERQLNRLLLSSRGTSSPTGTPVDRRRSISTVTGLTHQQLTDHYATCIKLSAENKINVKNAFNLQLIDYMNEILKRKDSGMNNFQVASCTLDASTKIYAYRVDSVHTDTLKMAGGLGRTKDKPEDDNHEDSKAKKRSKTKKSTTVVTNLKSIDVPHFDLEFDVDPLFKKTAAQFDEGRCGGGQFLSTLQLLDDSSQLILDSETMITDLIRDKQDAVMSNVVSIPTFLDMDKKLICPSFSDFEFNNWKPSQDDSMVVPPELIDNDDHAFDINAIPEPVEDDDYDEGFNNMDCDNEDFCNDGTAITVEGIGCKNKSLPGDKLEVVHLKDYLASGPLEYSYFDNKCMSAWAGPGHWKLKPLVQNRVSKVSTDRKKTHIVHKYNDDEDLEEHFKVLRKATKLTKTTVKNWSFANNTLPVDLHYKPHQFSKLYLRPEVGIRRHMLEISAEVDDNVGDYDYNNKNDQENYCADVDDRSNYEDNDGAFENSGFFSQTLMPSQETQMDDATKDFLGENLVEAPNKVAKINIGYARTAKKIDMKKLKMTMWSMLTTNDINKENQRNDANVTVDKMKFGESQSFSELYQEMMPRLPPKMAENLSVPLAFIALLHLANEHALRIHTTTNDLGDFVIKQD